MSAVLPFRSGQVFMFFEILFPLEVKIEQKALDQHLSFFLLDQFSGRIIVSCVTKEKKRDVDRC